MDLETLTAKAKHRYPDAPRVTWPLGVPYDPVALRQRYIDHQQSKPRAIVPKSQVGCSSCAAKQKAAARQIEAFRALWKELHTVALNGGLTLAWLVEFGDRIPCDDCKQHWKELVSTMPPRFDDQFAWTVAAHNAVNHRLGKAEMSVDDARKLYAV